MQKNLLKMEILVVKEVTLIKQRSLVIPSVILIKILLVQLLIQ